ncbi:hypothetical protein [Desulfonatronospira sp.]|uniref:hypothetical protein n=1 Tax=Desulfonatronospira sp. TaxID=1962951 RepID=UPI0025BE5C1F|nr:hypothetical protein [Desulfonatronospira sp.]
MNNNFECTDCEYCLPDSEGPTSKGICLLDPEFEPYIEEIMQFDFSNCHYLIQKKSFDFNCRACSDFSPAEYIEMIDFGYFGEKENDLDMQKIDFKNLPVEPYLQDLYSSSGSKRQEAVNTLGSLTILGNEKARDVLLAFLKELGPPETLEQAGFKAETLRHFHGHESNQDLLELLFSDLENTVSNNSTRQWITAILNFLGRAPLERIDNRLQSMVDRKIFSHRLKKRVLSVIDPMNREYY